MKAADNGCIEWIGTLRSNGYGSATVNYKSVLVHRFIYESKVGPIPKGMCIDHLCRNRKCVNVDHMEVVSIKENVLRGIGKTAMQARQTHCKRGHELIGNNLYVWPKRPSSRLCKACIKIREDERRIAKSPK